MLDVGANIGVFTLYAAAAGWPVIAVEASEANAMRLQESLTMNNFHNVTLSYKLSEAKQVRRGATCNHEWRGEDIRGLRRAHEMGCT